MDIITGALFFVRANIVAAMDNSCVLRHGDGLGDDDLKEFGDVNQGHRGQGVVLRDNDFRPSEVDQR